MHHRFIIVAALLVVVACAAPLPNVTRKPTWSIVADFTGLNFREDFNDIFGQPKSDTLVSYVGGMDVAGFSATSGALKWRVKNPNGDAVSTFGPTSMSQSEALIFAPGGLGVWAFERETGALKWNSTAYCSDIVQSPAVDVRAGRVYFVCGSTAFAVRESDGRPIWNLTGPYEFDFANVVLVGSDVLFLRTGTGIALLNATTGAVISTVEVVGLNQVELCAVGVAPRTVNVVYCPIFNMSSSNHEWGIAAFDTAKNGALLWTTRIESSGYPFVHRPTPTPCGTVVMTVSNGSATALEGLTGRIQWRLATSQNIAARPAILSAGVLVFPYSSATSGFIGVSCFSGVVQWAIDLGATTFANTYLMNPTIHGGSAVGFVTDDDNQESNNIISVPLFPLPQL